MRALQLSALRSPALSAQTCLCTLRKTFRVADAAFGFLLLLLCPLQFMITGIMGVTIANDWLSVRALAARRCSCCCALVRQRCFGD
jgi:hypothetical protein